MTSLAPRAPWIVIGPTLGAFGLVYLGATVALGHPDARALVRRVVR
jgi:hypothetical protein